ncbi:ExeM/NucH family extracellular endonuclease [Candidatus Albibeggiatoa sp. nov. NOAA]|uniref:ExeM/NucH family extracellular endonuclease n=1 Tax=Candidatus Albibeggiatoa sp. nov. NOAA TaxID=3162724 RepID=UPI0032FF6A72|nr:ExeM/NucH family extracellular endonuclease [Thiotrichaceae bacterium]
MKNLFRQPLLAMSIVFWHIQSATKCTSPKYKYVLQTLLFTCGLTLGQTGYAVTTGLIISEYIEGSGNNRAIEIYNGTGSSVDLSTYKLALYANGSSTLSQYISLTGTVANGDVHVVTNPTADSAIKSVADQEINYVVIFNGNDAVALWDGNVGTGALIDVVGQIGHDPGTGWGSGDTSTLNRTLSRKASVCYGHIMGGTFDPATEWDGAAEDTFSGLGSHTVSCDHINPEPTNYPTAFTVTTDSDSEITTSWTDATGTQVPTGYLIICSINGGFVYPTDKLTEVDDTDCSDNVGFKNITQGTETYTWTGLDPDTTHHFMIFPYTNSGLAINYKIDGSPQAKNVKTDVPITKIHEIQGTGGDSEYIDFQRTIEGIVVGDFQHIDGDVPNLGGFFVQEEDSDIDEHDNTSEGIFIYGGTLATVDVEVGDKVQVTGRVNEYRGMTEISSTPTVNIISKNNILPTATRIDLPLNLSPDQTLVMNDDDEWVVDLERYEGMLVEFSDALTITELYQLDRYGEFVASADGRLTQFTQTNTPNATDYLHHLFDIAARSITIDDGRLRQSVTPIYPDGSLDTSDVIRLGDTVTNLKGVINYGRGYINFGKQTYRLMPTELPSFTNTNARPANHSDVGGTLRVASFNVHHYFTTLSSRGADTSVELIRQTDKLLRVLISLDADIVGLQELENDYASGSSSTIAHLVSELNARVGAGTYDYIDPSTNIGSDDIAVGIIYKTASVTQTSGTTIETLDDSDLAALDMSGSIFNGSGTNRPPIATTFTDQSTNETFTLVVTHMKSKFSAGNYAGDSDADDGQGLSNETRLLGVQALKAWLATNPTSSPDDDFLIVGDFNAYAKEDPIVEMENDYTNIIGENNYSYIFKAQSGTLDYAFASSTLNAQVTGSTIWHINADEPDVFDYNENNNDSSLFDPTTPYRASDHDPIIVGLTLHTATSEITVKDSSTELSTSATVDLGSAVAGDPLSKILSIENTGDGDLVLSSVSLTGDFSFTNATSSTLTIPTSYSVGIELSDTSAIGDYSGTLSFTTNDSDESNFSISLTGTVTASNDSDNDIDNTGDTDNSSDNDQISSSKPTGKVHIHQDRYLLGVAGHLAHIKSSPSGIDCEYGEGSCTAMFDRGTTVQLELIKIKTADGFSQDDYDITWEGSDYGCAKQVVTMQTGIRCHVKVHGKQGMDYSADSATGNTDSSADNSNTNEPVTNQLEFLNFSGHSRLRGGAEDVILGFILKGSGTADVVLHADILDEGVMPQLDLNEIIIDEQGIRGNLLKRHQHSENFILEHTVGEGIYTMQMSSAGVKGRGMAGISLKNNQLNLTNLSVRGHLKDFLVLNFIISGEGTQKIQVNTQILSGDVVTELHLLNISTQQGLVNENIAEGKTIEVSTGAYAILLKVIEGEGIGMIEADLIQ